MTTDRGYAAAADRGDGDDRQRLTTDKVIVMMTSAALVQSAGIMCQTRVDHSIQAPAQSCGSYHGGRGGGYRHSLFT